MGKRSLQWMAALALVFAVGASHAATAAGKAWTVTNQPARIVNGSPILFRVTPPRPLRSLAAKWLGHDFVFDFDARTKTWFALAGVSQQTAPGAYPLALQGETASGEALAFEHRVRIERQRYPRVLLKVPGKYTAPSPEELKQVAEDKKTKEDAFKTVSPTRDWQGAFAAPVEAEISDVFGVQRVFNGAVQSTHQGLDFRVGPGTPIAAVNRGRVLLARPLFFEGNCVVLDHGQGLLTLYLHMSKFSVKEGDEVEKGQQLGLSGGTGRATGPHLHLAVRWQGVYLNPQILLGMKLP